MEERGRKKEEGRRKKEKGRRKKKAGGRKKKRVRLYVSLTRERSVERV
jgi:hypothetical protein